jgi:hypothetical protein
MPRLLNYVVAIYLIVVGAKAQQHLSFIRGRARASVSPNVRTGHCRRQLLVNAVIAASQVTPSCAAAARVDAFDMK